MSTADFSEIVGVFRERLNAEQAMESLKQIGFGEDQFHLTEYHPPQAEEASGPTLQASEKRFIILVKTSDRAQEAVGVMAQHGANNTDLPPGTMFDHGTIMTSTAEPVDLNPRSTTSAHQSSSDSLFGEEQVPGRPGEFTTMDNSNAPHG